MDASTLRVYFIHGLESGPNGVKGQYFKSLFKNYRSIQMPVAELRSFRRNPYKRQFFLACVAYLAYLCAGVYSYYYLQRDQAFFGDGTPSMDPKYAVSHWDLVREHLFTWYFVHAACFFSIPLVTLVFGGLAKFLHCRAVYYVLERCMFIQGKEIREFKPDVVIASSFGGAVLTHLYTSGLYDGPSLLIAPAQNKLNNMTSAFGYDLFDIYSDDAQQKIHAAGKVIVHGTRDTTILAEDSFFFNRGAKQLVDRVKARLLVYDDVHDMNSTLLGANQVRTQQEESALCVEPHLDYIVYLDKLSSSKDAAAAAAAAEYGSKNRLLCLLRLAIELHALKTPAARA